VGGRRFLVGMVFQATDLAKGPTVSIEPSGLAAQNLAMSFSKQFLKLTVNFL
jgi:hypothetical protein